LLAYDYIVMAEALQRYIVMAEALQRHTGPKAELRALMMEIENRVDEALVMSRFILTGAAVSHYIPAREPLGVAEIRKLVWKYMDNRKPYVYTANIWLSVAEETEDPRVKNLCCARARELLKANEQNRERPPDFLQEPPLHQSPSHW
jgi:hypothetical protein